MDNIKRKQRANMKFCYWQYFCDCGEHWIYQNGRRMHLKTFERFVREHYNESFRCAGCGEIFPFSKIAGM